MSKYFKAIEEGTGRHVMIEWYDEPKDWRFGLRTFEGKRYGEYSYMDETRRNYLAEGELGIGMTGLQEITETEYTIYQCCQIVITEFYMHGKTGGFPSDNASMAAHRLDRYIRNFFRYERESDAEMLANAISDMSKMVCGDA